MATDERVYDIVLFGATGYTGQYTAEHITTNFPTDLSWAVAGRSRQKLQGLVEDLKRLNPDRKQPGIEIAQLEPSDLNALATKTRVLLNTVGPYAHYGEPVVKACAENGTHYLDVTGETPWVKEMIDKYDHTAKQSGAIIIPQIGVESSPAESLTFAVTSLLRKEAKVFTREVVLTLHAIKGAPSGGTLATVLSIFDKYSLAEIARGSSAQGLCPKPIPEKPSTSLFTRCLGVRTVPDLGTLTTSIQAAADAPIVQRSWGLLSDTDESYGPNFRFSPYMTARNVLTGVMTHFALTIFPIFLLLPPIRWLLAKIVYQPGQGPSREDARNHYLEYRAVATADSKVGQRAFAKLAFQGSAYLLTGILLSEGARTILLDKDVTAKRLGGGLLTPATLGAAYIDRLKEAGVRIETRMLPNTGRR